jgi:hypothetical protein
MSAPEISPPALVGGGTPIGGSGTTGKLAKFTASSTIGDSVITEASGLVGVGCTDPANTLETYASGASGIRASSDTLANITVSQTSGNAVGATLTMRKTRGNRASPSLVNSGDAIGTIQFNAYGAADNTLSTVKSNVVTYTSTTDISSNLTFAVSPAGSATATEVMRVTPGTAAIPIGNVGIATTTPLAKLDVAYGDYQTAGALCIGADVGTLSTRTNSTGKFGAISIPHFTNAAANCFLIGAYSNTATTTTTAIGGGYTGINASTRVSLYTGATSTTSPGTETAYAVPAGFYLGSTSTLIFNASVSGQGIKLSATPGNGDANTLDCYAEADWTPVDKSGASLAITFSNAKVTRIGRLVHCCFVAIYPITASALVAKISLPFACTGTDASPLYPGTAAIGFNDSTATNMVAQVVSDTTRGTHLYFHNPSADVPNSTMSTKTIQVSVTYQIY